MYVIDQELPGIGVGRVVEKFLPITNHDGIARAAGRCADARDRTAIGNGEQQNRPIVIGYITAISSAFAYLTVVGTPACTIVYASGYLKASDFLKVGWKMCVMSIIVMMLCAYFYWPLLGT